MKTQMKNLNQTINIMEKNFIKLPTPSSISYMWNMGSMLGLTLIIQIMSGIILSMHFKPDISMAFESTIHIMREVNEGCSTRAIHSNGASMFFVLIYTHIFRGKINSSFKKSETWISGTIMLMLLMATAFMGYVLPWGQMSFWGATVITNLASAIPFLGEDIVLWMWGGFSVSDPTLNRFLSIHFFLPFILSALSVLHLLFLHKNSSSNPTGISSKSEMLSFHPFFSFKDAVTPAIIIPLFLILSEKTPSILMDPENFMPANPMSTPIHIQPEWYFLFAYAILRAVPNKLGGVSALLMSILILMVITLFKKKSSSSKFNPKMKLSNMVLLTSFIMLTWLGAKPMEEPFSSMSKVVSIIYFSSMMM